MFITMRKITLVLLALVMTAGQLFAANPMRRLFPVSQSDGTEVMVNRVGNGIVGFYATPDGWCAMPQAICVMPALISPETLWLLTSSHMTKTPVQLLRPTM